MKIQILRIKNLNSSVHVMVHVVFDEKGFPHTLDYKATAPTTSDNNNEFEVQTQPEANVKKSVQIGSAGGTTQQTPIKYASN